MSYFDDALKLWDEMGTTAIEFGRKCAIAIDREKRTIRDISVALCGNASLEDRISRYIQAAEFHDSLNPYQYVQIKEYLTPTHYTELQRIENQFDREIALEWMEELVTKQPDGIIDVKPVEWLRARRNGLSGGPSLDARKHKLWMFVTRLLPDIIGDIEKKGKLATEADEYQRKVLVMVIDAFQARQEEVAS